MVRIIFSFLFILLVSCNNKSQKQSVGNNEHIEIKADSLNEKGIQHSGLDLLTFFKDSVKFENNQQTPKLTLTYKDFFTDPSDCSYANYYSLEEGQVVDVEFTDNLIYIKIKEDKEEAEYSTWLSPDNPNILNKLKKHLRVGSNIKAVFIPEGAKYLQIVELIVY